MKKINFDTNNLHTRILADYGTIKRFSETINMNPRTLAGRLSGRTQFYVSEIETICKVMNLSAEECNLYFFTEKGKLEEFSSIVHGMTEEQYKLTLEINELISGRPDRCEIMRKWTGNINDLVAALAQI